MRWRAPLDLILPGPSPAPEVSRSEVLFFAYVLAATIKLLALNVILAPSAFYAWEMLFNLAFYLPLEGLLTALLLKVKARWLLLPLYAVRILYIYCHMTYFLGTGGILHLWQWWPLIGEGVESIAVGNAPLHWHMLLVFIDTIPLIGLLAHMRRHPGAFQQMRLLKIRRRYSLGLPLLIMLASAPFRGDPVQLYHYPGESDNTIVQRYGMAVLNLMDLAFPEGESALKVSTRQINVASKPPGDRPNVIVIVVESLDAHILNTTYKGRYVMPFLHALSRKSVYYPYTLAYHAAGGSSDGLFAFVNSVQPLRRYPTLKLRKYDYPNSIVKRLVGAGYRALAFQGMRGSFFAMDIAMPKMGYHVYYDQAKMGLPKEWASPDEKLFKFVTGKLERAQRPFYYHVTTLTSHEPFDWVYPLYKNQHHSTIKTRVIRDLFDSFSYVDRELKKAWPALTRHPNTYIFIFGDHIPYSAKDEIVLFRHELYRNAAFYRDDELFEYVPLVIVTPDRAVHFERRYAASFLDVGPTILNAAGIGGRYATDGANLLDRLEPGGEIPFVKRRFGREQLYRWAAKTAKR